MKASYKDNKNKNLLVGDIYFRLHVFEPDESVNQQDWYKDMTTFNNSQILNYIKYIQVGDIIEDDSGARFKILSRHWKWDKEDNGTTYPVFEMTAERYMRRGKQNPYML